MKRMLSLCILWFVCSIILRRDKYVYLTMKYSKNLVGDGCLFGGVERMRRPSMRIPRTGGGVIASSVLVLVVRRKNIGR